MMETTEASVTAMVGEIGTTTELAGDLSAKAGATRLVSTSAGALKVVRRAHQVYDVYRSGVELGEVRKFNSWFAYANPPWGTAGTGNDEPRKTRKEAIEVLLTLTHGA